MALLIPRGFGTLCPTYTSRFWHAQPHVVVYSTKKLKSESFIFEKKKKYELMQIIRFMYNSPPCNLKNHKISQSGIERVREELSPGIVGPAQIVAHLELQWY